MVAIPTLRSYIYIRMKVRVGGGGWGGSSGGGAD